MKLSKAEKKIQRKQIKSRQCLLNDEIELIQMPTSHIIICNVGLITGASQENLRETFKNHEKIKNIVLIPNKPYSFITFDNQLEAEKVLHKFQGMPFLHGKTGGQIRMHLAFVKEVAECKHLLHQDLPSGLILLRDYISEEYECNILKSLNWECQQGIQGNQLLKNRQVLHFGYEFQYDTNNIDWRRPLPQGIPKISLPLLDRLVTDNYIKEYPDQLTVNKYQPGQGIPPHVDTHSACEDAIISLSLGSDIVMEFYHPDGKHIPVLLSQRSVLIMTGESRYLWSHGITPRKTDVITTNDGSLTSFERRIRTSFTFRKVRRKECLCQYKEQCDSQKDSLKKSATENLSSKEAVALEETYVRQVYNIIAPHFSETRHKPWPSVKEFVDSLQPGDILIDVGCGNGKYFSQQSKVFQLGCDSSLNLMKISHSKGFQVLCADILSLPLRRNIADACICIAVIHHLSTQDRRRLAVTNLVNLLRSGGRALIYVWAMEQDIGSEQNSYLKASRETSKQKAAIVEKSQHQSKEMYGCDNLENISKDCDSILTSTKLSEMKQENQEIDSNNCKDNLHSKIIDISSQKEYRDDKNEANSTEITKSEAKFKNPLPLPVHLNRTNFEHQDILVPWHTKSSKKDNSLEATPTQLRYYHMFQQHELINLCKSINDCEIIESYYDKGNWCIILQKKN